MITTVTLNPAVDKTCTATSLMPGQVNRMEQVMNLAGGKGINVTKVLRQMGYPVRAMGFLGGYTGRFIEECVSDIGARCEFTRISQDTRSSMNILSQDGYVTEILEPGPVITGEELDSLWEEYKRALPESELVILSGSVPNGVEDTIYKRLIEQAGAVHKRVLLDTSGSFLKQGVEAKPFMIKPNVRELEALTGKRIRDMEEIIHTGLALIESGIRHVLISMGYKGLLYICGKDILYARAPMVKVVNTVGCGDSVVAAFAASLMEQETMEQTLRRCVAVSAANATTQESAVIPMELAAELLDKIEIEEY